MHYPFSCWRKAEALPTFGAASVARPTGHAAFYCLQATSETVEPRQYVLIFPHRWVQEIMVARPGVAEDGTSYTEKK
jgi:hypothetical protein